LLPLPYILRDCTSTRRHLPRVELRTTLSAGFSLVEIMVGMVIGLIGMIVILQVFSVFEAQKRTTTGGDDAQNTAAIALFGMQHDIEQAGYGISDVSLFSCPLLLQGKSIPLAPVTINPATTIVPAGDLNTDTLLVFYGNTNGMPQGNVIDSSSGLVYTLKIPGASNFNNLDNVVAAPVAGNPVSAAACTTTLPIQQVSGVPTATTLTIASGTAGAGALFDLGPTPQMLAYRINKGNLTVCDYFARNCGDATKAGDDTFWLPIAYSVVSLKAQYGRDVAAGTMDGIVDQYDRATPSTNCGWARTSAVRLALVARNSQLEKTDFQTAAPDWAGTTASASGVAANPIDLQGDGKWKRYRYKVFQTVIPLRNVVWMGVVPGC